MNESVAHNIRYVTLVPAVPTINIMTSPATIPPAKDSLEQERRCLETGVSTA
jgi:hypothetical protein